MHFRRHARHRCSLLLTQPTAASAAPAWQSGRSNHRAIRAKRSRTYKIDIDPNLPDALDVARAAPISNAPGIGRGHLVNLFRIRFDDVSISYCK
jgi:hypothetical protein